ncbi:MAG: T9SS type A sorting domain-containing protein [Flavobacteriales bacterium]|nr:T9SS type A sorting domain-containing protein [Flavobacteriales bacterium]
MRNVLALSTLLLTCSLFAQTNPHHVPRRIFIPDGRPVVPTLEDLQRASATVLWSEDFETGLNGWTVNTSTGPVVWTTTSTGNTGGYTPGPLQSTTGYPGGTWIAADSDLMGAAGVSENTTITSPPITTLGLEAYMLLRFEQSFRQLNDDQTIVEVSANGGTNWTLYPVNTEIPGNQSTPGAPQAETVYLNITGALNGGSNDIRIRFHWLSDEGYTYSWQVDDVALLAVEQNDLRLLSATYADWNTDEDNFAGVPYSIYPIDELRELKFKAMVINNGSQTQTNVRLKVDVDGPGSNDVTLYSQGITLAPGEVDSLFILGYTPIAQIGIFLLDMELVQDQIEDLADDNSTLQRFEVQPDRFSRDLGAMDSDLDNQGIAYEAGNWFHVLSFDQTLYAIEIALSARTDPGVFVKGVLYDQARNFVMETEAYEVQNGDLNTLGGSTYLCLPLINPVPLLEDQDYLVTAAHFGGPLEVWVATSGTSTPLTSLLLDGAQNNWFYLQQTPMVRMNLDPTASVTEQGASQHALQAAPSVFDESTVIRFELPSSARTTWQLTDVSGRIIAGGDLGVRTAGQNSLELSGSDLAPGAYLFTLLDQGTRSTLRIVRNGVR